MEMEKSLGRYQIEKYLGSGAYADVYQAMDSLVKRILGLYDCKQITEVGISEFKTRGLVII